LELIPETALANELGIEMFHNGTVFPALMEPQPKGLGEGSRLRLHSHLSLPRWGWDDPTRLWRIVAARRSDGNVVR